MPSDPPDEIEAMRGAVKANLPQIARELLAWSKTGVLPDGIVRKLAASLVRVDEFARLAVVEHAASYAALEAVEKQDGQA